MDESHGQIAHLGWHPEDIKAAVRKRGSTLAEISRSAGLCSDACRQALRSSWPLAEQAIADFLGVPRGELFPGRPGVRRVRRRRRRPVRALKRVTKRRAA